MNKYEVSVPLFVLPFVEVEAKDEKEAKAKAGDLICDSIRNAFHKCDIRTMDGVGFDSKDWKIEKIDTEKDKAIAILKKFNVSTDNLVRVEVEKKEVGERSIEFIFLDFEENLNDGNLCYLRIDGRPIFLADTDKGYPSCLEESYSYVWVDEEGNFFFLNEEFKKIYLNPLGGWDTDITYLRAVDINKRFEYEGVVLVKVSMTSIVARSSFDRDSVKYIFNYAKDNDVIPSSCVRIEDIEIN